MTKHKKNMATQYAGETLRLTEPIPGGESKNVRLSQVLVYSGTV